MTLKTDLLILDGRHLLYRTSDAFRDLESKTSDGESFPTGGMYGFLNVSIKIHNIYGGVVVVAWEGDSRNFRLGLFPEYKRRNEPMDEDKADFISEMTVQESCVKQFLKHMGVRQYLGVNCEADDVIGRLARTVSARGKRVFIYSGDSDLRALVTDPGRPLGNGGVWAVSPGMRRQGDKVYDYDAVVERHGVPPDKLAELKALAGDKSDNVPGVRGIGDKTAAKLINCYGSLKLVRLAAMGDDPIWPVAERFKKLIAECADLGLYHKLTTIDCECDMVAIRREKRQAEVVKLMMMYKFRSLAGPAELYTLMRMGG